LVKTRAEGQFVKYVFLTRTRKTGKKQKLKFSAKARRHQDAWPSENHFSFAPSRFGDFALFFSAKGFPSPYLLVDRAGTVRHFHGMAQQSTDEAGRPLGL
jgi:hypothetical protein